MVERRRHGLNLAESMDVDESDSVLLKVQLSQLLNLKSGFGKEPNFRKTKGIRNGRAIETGTEYGTEFS